MYQFIKKHKSPIFFFLIGLTFLSRFFLLSEKPFHHDESLHAYYSLKVARGEPYDYSPMLHGPVLYYLTGIWMAVTGFSDFLARFPAALCSALFVLSPFLLWRQVGLLRSGFLSLFFLVSPTFLFYGRFLREDVFTLLWIVLFLISSFLYLNPRGAFQKKRPFRLTCAAVAGTAAALHFANKENSYVHFGIWLLFFPAYFLFSRSLHPEDQLDTRWKTLFSPSAVAVFLSFFTFTFILFFSSFFQHSEGWWHGVLDGLYRESLGYWFRENKSRRIDGAFDYYIPLLATYEFILLPFLGFALARATQKIQHYRIKISLIALNIFFFVATLLPPIGYTAEACRQTQACLSSLSELANLLHLDSSRHMAQILFYLSAGFTGFLAGALQKNLFSSFLWFWLTGVMGAYSYLGEKVPWLSVYMLLPLAILCVWEAVTLFSQLHSQKRRYLSTALGIWLSFAGCLTLVKSLRLNYYEYANPVERMVYTQTSQELKELIKAFPREAIEWGLQEPRVAYGEGTAWPLVWYLQPFHNERYFTQLFERQGEDGEVIEAADIQAENWDILFVDDTHITRVLEEFPEYAVYRVPLRVWWLPNRYPDFMQYMRYFFSHKPWRLPNGNSGLGSKDILMLERFNCLEEQVGRFCQRKYKNRRELELLRRPKNNWDDALSQND